MVFYVTLLIFVGAVAFIVKALATRRPFNRVRENGHNRAAQREDRWYSPQFYRPSL